MFKPLDALEVLCEADRIVDGVVDVPDAAPTAAEATPAFERIALLPPVLAELTTRLAKAFVRAPEPPEDVACEFRSMFGDGCVVTF